MFQIMTALTFIGIPTAKTIECSIGFNIVFEIQIRQPQNHDDTLLEKVNLNRFTMDLTLNKTLTLK